MDSGDDAPRGRPRLHVDSTPATSRFCGSPYRCPRPRHGRKGSKSESRVPTRSSTRWIRPPDMSRASRSTPKLSRITARWATPVSPSTSPRSIGPSTSPPQLWWRGRQEAGRTGQRRGGGSECFGHSMRGVFPDTDAPGGLAEDSFAVATPLVNGAWLKWRLPLVDIGPEDELIPFDLANDGTRQHRIDFAHLTVGHDRTTGGTANVLRK